MRTLNKLKSIIPNFFKDHVDCKNPSVEICQIHEFPEFFVVLSYSTFEEEYLINRIEKPAFNEYEECNLFDNADIVDQNEFDQEVNPDFEFFTEINDLEDYANFRFSQAIGVEGL
ncbi:hypothetical protein Ac42p034 [Acinetobacter phage Ac42]|uniref:hypothetical protein n=1 Tax=Acinetobacter phage Ac42 TaxID=762660 RepID=UPI0001EBCC84|nr:hypothetical protein Ac42p034 [Acinetobacter phage Ac42]ADI96272.1 hypothetical protein Ac42p034 [Acinetobacter phage Ac42]